MPESFAVSLPAFCCCDCVPSPAVAWWEVWFYRAVMDLKMYKCISCPAICTILVLCLSWPSSQVFPSDPSGSQCLKVCRCCPLIVWITSRHALSTWWVTGLRSFLDGLNHPVLRSYNQDMITCGGPRALRWPHQMSNNTLWWSHNLAPAFS